MKNKFFSAGLYREGLRQMRIPGIALACISLLIALIDFFNYNGASANISATSLSVAVFLAMYIATPAMVLLGFNFLNSRRAADFYHSIPQTRTTLAVSFFAASMTWSAGSVLMNAILSILTVSLGGVAVVWSEWFIFIANALSALLLLNSLGLIAVSIATGAFNQLICAGLIAFLPRILINNFGDLASQAVPVLTGLEDYLGRFAEYNINPIFSDNTRDMYSCLYGVVLSAIYFTIGLICFNRRRSEAATQTAMNKGVQCALRVLVAFILCIYPCQELSRCLINTQSVDGSGLVLSYGFAIIFYYLYEAITSRRIKGVLRVTGEMGIGLLVLAALNLLFIFGPAVVANSALNANLGPDKVAAVVLTHPSANETRYEALSVSAVELDDEQLIEQLCDVLDGNIKTIKAGKNPTLDRISGMTNYYFREDMYVQFRLNDGSTATRIIYPSKKEKEAIDASLCDNEQYMSALRAFPKWEELTLIDSSSIVDKAMLRDLYKSLEEEVTSLPDSSFLAYINDTYSGKLYFPAPKFYTQDTMHTKYLSDCFITLEGYKDGKFWYNNYQLNGYLPKTYKLYTEYLNCPRNMSTDDFLRFTSGVNDGEFSYVSIECISPKVPENLSASCALGFGNGVPGDIDNFDYDYEAMNRVINDIVKNWNRKPNSSDAYYRIDASYGVYDEAGYESGVREVFIVPCTDVDSFIQTMESQSA